ncbi:MAG: phosphate acyltransferase PlsX [Candidatus Eisenbacteria sp.]|nr:phosphate acyltransferase PlsX [Candidatus Eisenbacteria bacterium]
MEAGQRKVRIAVDAMGSDVGPEIVVRGSIQAVRDMAGSVEVVLVGNEPTIWAALRSEDAEGLPLVVVHARERIGMSEKARQAYRRKRDSSIAVCASLVQTGRAEALVSTGNTGAVVTTFLLNLGRTRGIKRPAIASVIPTSEGQCVMLDVGANADCKPLHLYQFAQMGRTYAQLILGISNPRVGLLNIGEEPSKGSALAQAAHQLLAQGRDQLNFIGNVEGRDIFGSKADVVVCDGFTGNVILKLAGSLASFGSRAIKREIQQSLAARCGALLMKPAFRSLGRRFNYEEYGGALLLGTRGVCVIGHGRSSPRAIRNAIDVAARSVRSSLEDSILQIIEADRTVARPIEAQVTPSVGP